MKQILFWLVCMCLFAVTNVTAQNTSGGEYVPSIYPVITLLGDTVLSQQDYKQRELHSLTINGNIAGVTSESNFKKILRDYRQGIKGIIFNNGYPLTNIDTLTTKLILDYNGKTYFLPQFVDAKKKYPADQKLMEIVNETKRKNESVRKVFRIVTNVVHDTLKIVEQSDPIYVHDTTKIILHDTLRIAEKLDCGDIQNVISSLKINEGDTLQFYPTEVLASSSGNYCIGYIPLSQPESWKCKEQAPIYSNFTMPLKPGEERIIENAINKHYVLARVISAPKNLKLIRTLELIIRK